MNTKLLCKCSSPNTIQFQYQHKKRHGVITKKTVIFKIRHCKNVKFNRWKSQQHHIMRYNDFINVLSEISPSGVTNCPFPFKHHLTNSVKHRPFWGNNSSSVKNLPESYGTRRYTIVDATTRHLYLSWARWIKFTLSNTISLRYFVL